MKSAPRKRFSSVTYVLERTFECHFPKLKLGDSPGLIIRLEVLRSATKKNQFFARVSRLDTNRIQPTFPQYRGSPKFTKSDETFWVQDNFLWVPDRSFRAASLEKATSLVLADISKKLTLKL
jgi:hypothetical protein